MKTSVGGKKASVKQKIEQRIASIEEELRRLKIDLSELSEEEERSSDEIREGDLVKSKQEPYYNGEVTGFSSSGYWVYILDTRGIKRKKAKHNVFRVSSL